MERFESFPVSIAAMGDGGGVGESMDERFHRMAHRLAPKRTAAVDTRRRS